MQNLSCWNYTWPLHPAQPEVKFKIFTVWRDIILQFRRRKTRACFFCPDNDHERLSLVQKTKSGKWVTDDGVHIAEVKDDVVKFKLHSPMQRSLSQLHSFPAEALFKSLCWIRVCYTTAILVVDVGTRLQNTWSVRTTWIVKIDCLINQSIFVY